MKSQVPRVAMRFALVAAALSGLWSLKNFGLGESERTGKNSASGNAESSDLVLEAIVEAPVGLERSLAVTANTGRLPASVASTGKRLVVRVETRRKVLGDPGVEPGIEVVAGFGVGLNPYSTELGRAVSGEDGFAQIVLEGAEVDLADREQQPLWVRVVHKGLYAAPRQRKWPWRDNFKKTKIEGTDPKGIGVTLRLDLKACRILRGQLVTTEGVSCAGKVTLHCNPSTSIERLRDDLGTRISTSHSVPEHGWFEIENSRAGAYQVRAWAEHGTAVAKLEIVMERTEETVGVTDVGKLVIQGPGRLSGVVRDPGGKPAVGLRLYALHCDSGNESGSHLLDSRKLPLDNQANAHLAAQGAGYFRRDFRTGVDGRFEFDGLLTGSYMIWASASHSEESKPILLSPQAVPADGREVELTFRRAHIVVHVQVPVDSKGKVNVQGYASIFGVPPKGKAENCFLLCSPIDSENYVGRGSLPERTFLAGLEISPLEFLFEVQAGHSYLLALSGDKTRFDPTSLFVPVNAGRVEVALQWESRKAGRLVLRAEDGEGKPIRKPSIVQVCSRQNGLCLALRKLKSRDDWPMHMELPAGEYRLVFDGRSDSDNHHGVLEHARAFGRYESDLVIRPGEDTELLARLPEGGRLKLKLAGKASPMDRQALVDELGRRAKDVDLYVDWRSKCAQVYLIPDSGWLVPVEFQSEETGGLFEGLLIGNEQTSEILPAGHFRLCARSQSGRLASTRVLLIDGETTEVTLWMN